MPPAVKTLYDKPTSNHLLLAPNRETVNNSCKSVNTRVSSCNHAPKLAATKGLQLELKLEVSLESLKKSLRFPNQPSQCPCCDYFPMNDTASNTHPQMHWLIVPQVSATASSHYWPNVNFICLHNDLLHPQRTAVKRPLVVEVLACHGWNPRFVPNGGQAQRC